MVKSGTSLLGELLVEAGALNFRQLEEASSKAETSGKSICRIIVEERYLPDRLLMEILQERLGLRSVDLERHEPDPVAAAAVPEELARRHHLIPIGREGRRLLLAMADPTDSVAIEEVSIVTAAEIEPVIAPERAIHSALDRFFGSSGREQGGIPAAPETTFLPDDDSVVAMVNSIIWKAVSEGASDIHIEPTGKGMRVRLRIDGFLRDYLFPPEGNHARVVSRIKVMAQMNIAEKRLPQDGQIELRRGHRIVNIRVSTLPTIYGEKMVLRLLEKERIILSLEKIGFSRRNKEFFMEFIRHSHGIILLTGPTGCGKTTTLYSALSYLNNPACNIVTVEDPIEFRLDGINQVQVNRKIDLTFAASLRTILRQDPDIIMIGEMRDLETAEVGMRASLTGHLVFSTLHTNNASQAVTRLVDMGVPPFLVSSTLVGVVAQRLVRKICPHCREEYAPGDEDRELYRVLGGGRELPPVLYRGEGCRRCNGGYRGRTAIHEIQPITPEMRTLIMEGATPALLQEKALALGCPTLFQDGLLKAEEGISTLDEIKRVALSEF